MGAELRDDAEMLDGNTGVEDALCEIEELEEKLVGLGGIITSDEELELMPVQSSL